MADPLRASPFFNLSMRRFPTHFNFAFHNMFSYRFYFFQAQGDMAAGYPHNVFSFAIPILLNILVLKYQNQQHQSPFQTHPKTVLSGILSLLLYCLAYDYQQRLGIPPRSLALARSFHRCILFFGYMAIAISASLIFPDSASPAFYVLYVTLSVGDLLFLVYQRIRREVRRTRFQGRPNSPFLTRLWRTLAQRNSNQGHLLPL